MRNFKAHGMCLPPVVCPVCANNIPILLIKLSSLTYKTHGWVFVFHACTSTRLLPLWVIGLFRLELLQNLTLITLDRQASSDKCYESTKTQHVNTISRVSAFQHRNTVFQHSQTAFQLRNTAFQHSNTVFQHRNTVFQHSHTAF